MSATSESMHAGKKPVILQVLPELKAGGVERGTVEMAAAIARAGWRSLVASAGGPMVQQLRQVGAEHVTLPLATKNPLAMWKNAHHLKRIIKTYEVDIVHARSRAPAWSALKAARATKTPFVTTFHGVYNLQNEFKRQYNGVMAKGDRVIAISHFVAQHILDHYAINPDNIRVIHRGVDFRQFDPERISHYRMAELAKEWRIPDGVPLVLLPGRITRWKGQDILVRALSRLPHRNFFCVLLGDDEKHPRFRKAVERGVMALGMGDHVRIAGHTPYMAEALTLAHVVVSASREPEAFGRVAVEAQAMGRPIIATDHGGSQETVIPGVTGWLVPPDDPDAMAEALEQALSLTHEQMQLLGEHCMHHIHQNFSSHLMCERTMQVYEELLGNVLQNPVAPPSPAVAEAPAPAPDRAMEAV